MTNFYPKIQASASHDQFHPKIQASPSHDQFHPKIQASPSHDQSGQTRMKNQTCLPFTKGATYSCTTTLPSHKKFTNTQTQNSPPHPPPMHVRTHTHIHTFYPHLQTPSPHSNQHTHIPCLPFDNFWDLCFPLCNGLPLVIDVSDLLLHQASFPHQAINAVHLLIKGKKEKTHMYMRRITQIFLLQQQTSHLNCLLFFFHSEKVSEKPFFSSSDLLLLNATHAQTKREELCYYNYTQTSFASLYLAKTKPVLELRPTKFQTTPYFNGTIQNMCTLSGLNPSSHRLFQQPAVFHNCFWRWREGAKLIQSK